MLNFPDHPTVGQIFADAIYLWVWDGEKWVAGGTPASLFKYIVGCFVPGLMTANQQLLMHRLSKSVTFPANFGTSLGHFSQTRGIAATTGSLTIDIRRATSASPLTFATIGAINFIAGALYGTFTTAGGIPVTFNIGDTISLFAPASPDATFANFTATLVGFEA
jgi:hypothetical protein